MENAIEVTGDMTSAHGVFAQITRCHRLLVYGEGECHLASLAHWGSWVDHDPEHDPDFAREWARGLEPVAWDAAAGVWRTSV